MTGCTKTGVKNAIEAIGQYLIDNSEKIAGDFDGMIDFDLEVSFKTNTDEASWPEIKFANHHYLPFTEELSEKIFNAKESENAEFHCGIEESGFHAYNCNDCPNKCEEWYQWDKEMKND